ELSFRLVPESICCLNQRRTRRLGLHVGTRRSVLRDDISRPITLTQSTFYPLFRGEVTVDTHFHFPIQPRYLFSHPFQRVFVSTSRGLGRSRLLFRRFSRSLSYIL